MKFLLDTHLLLLAAGQQARLSAGVRKLIDNSANAMLFSAGSIWDVAIKRGLGRDDFQPRLLRRGSARQRLQRVADPQPSRSSDRESSADPQRSLRPSASRASYRGRHHASHVRLDGGAVSGTNPVSVNEPCRDSRPGGAKPGCGVVGRESTIV